MISLNHFLVIGALLFTFGLITVATRRNAVGEGILGLRRAFQIAGARTLILSLWKVEDTATRDFMRRLYESRRNGMSTAEAMRNAGRDTLKARRAAGKSTSPFYWGAFVAAGEWR